MDTDSGHIVRAVVYLDLDATGNRVPGVGRSWFDEWMAVASPLVEVIAGGGDAAMLHMADEASPIAAASFSVEGWQRLLDRLDDDPHSLAVDLDAEIGTDERLLFRSLNMRRKVWSTSARRYAALTFEGRLSDRADLTTASDRIFETFLAACGDADPVYGEASVDGQPVVPATMLDYALGRTWEESLDGGRDWLRGHDWLTLCPRELVPALGGPGALRDTGAFTDVRTMACGAAVLRTVGHAAGHDRDASRRAAEAFAKILPG